VSAPIRVLVVDDEAFVRESLMEILKSESMRVAPASNANEAVRALETQSFDVIVTDLKMPRGDGMMLLNETRKSGVAIPIIVVTGVGTVSSAVDAMKAGAFDFVQKPVDPAELALLVRRAAEHRELQSEVKQLRSTVADLRAPRGLVGNSPAMKRVREAIAKVAPTDATILLLGESGTGKELAAEEIHRASTRASQPFVRVSCAALSFETLEAELYGTRGASGAGRGSSPEAGGSRRMREAPAGTANATRSSSAETEDARVADSNGDARIGKLAEAQGGTLVLDKIGMLDLSGQAKLLGILERGEYQVPGEPRARKADVRVIAIAIMDLAARVKSGAFRADLFYHLNQFPIEMPPLRAHKEDIPEIAEQLLERARRRQRVAGANATAPKLSRETLDVLASYDWPGNVRELANAIERALIVADAGELDAELFRGILESSAPSARSMESNEFHLRKNLDALERDIVLRAIAHTQGKKKEASLLLGIDPRNLGYYLRKHKITET
jgi:DNA-binding NtrC family response regulator